MVILANAKKRFQWLLSSVTPNLGPVYTLSLTTMESLENVVATHFGATPLWSMRTVL